MDAKRIAAAVAVVAIVVILVLALARGCDDGGGKSAAVDEGLTLAGDTLGGDTFDLADTRGKVTVVNFFASWCSPCNEEAPELVEFAQAHPDVAFVGVATNDGLNEASAFVGEYGIRFPVVFDGDGRLGGPWGIEYLPTTLFLDADGREQERIVGGATLERFEEALEAVR